MVDTIRPFRSLRGFERAVWKKWSVHVQCNHCKIRKYGSDCRSENKESAFPFPNNCQNDTRQQGPVIHPNKNLPRARWSPHAVRVSALATNKEVVVHLVRQSGRGESSEDRSARFQPTKIKVSGMRKRKVATKYMPATRIRLCAYSVTVEIAL